MDATTKFEKWWQTVPYEYVEITLEDVPRSAYLAAHSAQQSIIDEQAGEIERLKEHNKQQKKYLVDAEWERDDLKDKLHYLNLQPCPQCKHSEETCSDMSNEVARLVAQNICYRGALEKIVAEYGNCEIGTYYLLRDIARQALAGKEGVWEL